MWAKPSVPALARELRRICLDALPEPMLRERVNLWQREQGVSVAWHPAEEGLSIDLREDGSLVAWAVTNTVGPGYHAFLIELLDRISAQWGVRWSWENAGEDEGGDETGYALHRDMRLLQDEMTAWLRQVARIVLERDGAQNLFVSMPIGPMPHFAGFVGSPMGIWDEPRFRDAADDAGDALVLAREFFPWWQRGFQADFWGGMARVGLWCDVSWVGPRDQAERDTLRGVLESDRRASALDPDRALAPALRDELHWLLERGAEIELPQAEGPGYKRLPTRHVLYGGSWSVEVPGHFIEHQLNDGKNLQYVGDRRAVYVSSLSVAADDGSLPPAAELLETASGEAGADLRWAHDDILACAYWERDRDGGVRHLYAACAVDGQVLLLTITDELDAAQDWAEAVARSVRWAPRED
ncbi:hypothetical protein [Pseudomonas sp. CGJS7]|uniref:hypothetical protein n=1 Tax=Pseudomonas sp. CGJS7 TaxID=3109348 RepID=UPI00300BB287